jgi:hypothetical protein
MPDPVYIIEGTWRHYIHVEVVHTIFPSMGDIYAYSPRVSNSLKPVSKCLQIK